MLFSFNCFAACPITTGTIQYTAGNNAPAYINYQTGIGYCEPSENPGGVILDIAACEDSDKLNVGGKYIIGLQLLLEGFEFELPVSATPVSYAIKLYSNLDDLCNGVNGINLNLSYTYATDNPTKMEIFSEISEDLVQINHPYILVELPNFKYNPGNLDPSKNLKVLVGIIDANVICPSCHIAICDSTINIGDISCVDTFSMEFPYSLVNQKDWWSGYAITNKSIYPGQYKIYLYTPTDVYIFNKNIKGLEVSTFSINELMDTTPYSGTCWVRIESDFPMDGICFFGNMIGHSCYLGRR
jgi:hypothetical protein